jgi:hypothetical protein
MDRLRGCRVVLVDDKPEEAEPIIRSLGLKGVPVAYFKISGEEGDEPPKHPCPPGIRLAILDIELGLNLPGDKQRVGYLLQVFRQIIRTDNGPYMVVLWTNFPGDKELFEAEIFREQTLPNPVVIVMLEKFKYLRDLGAIVAKLEEELNRAPTFRILQFWEESAFNATSEVTNRLSEIVDFKAKDINEWVEVWKAGVSQIIKAMASEEYGEGLTDPQSTLSAFYTSLNPLHGDRLEALTSKPPEALADTAADVLKAGDCSDEKRARINSMLHIATEGLEKLWTGNSYLLPDNEKKPLNLPNKEELVEEFLRGKKSEKERWNEDKGLVTKVCVPLLVDINPACDYAQDKVKVLRLLAGVLVPKEHRNVLKQPNQKRIGEFLWTMRDLYLTKELNNATIYDLYLSARLLYSISPEEGSKLKPLLRLRAQAAVALQAWFSAHAARVGLFLLKPSA